MTALAVLFFALAVVGILSELPETLRLFIYFVAAMSFYAWVIMAIWDLFT